MRCSKRMQWTARKRLSGPQLCPTHALSANEKGYPQSGQRREAAAVKERGATTIEFALVAILFFTILFAIIDFGWLFLQSLTMQHAVREGARYAVVGRTDLDPDPQGTAQDRCDAAIEAIKDSSMGFYSSLSPVITFKTVDAAGNIVALPANSCWSAGQIIVIEITCTASPLTPFVRPFFKNGKYEFSVSTTMKNEAFK